MSNVLYAPCKMFLESHAPGIQTLINESTQFEYLIVSVASSTKQMTCQVKMSEEHDTERAFKWNLS